VPSGAALHVRQIARRRHHVAQMQDVERACGPDADMVQPRSAAVGEGEVMDVALAVQPHRPEPRIAAIVGLGVFGQAEAQLSVEIVRRLHVRREAVDVIDALDAGRPDRRCSVAASARLDPS